ncbi:MAG: lysylphosphatidylglycerol synthase transmembrane domain-containing protein [Phycisphaeraceae bacterium]
MPSTQDFAEQVQPSGTGSATEPQRGGRRLVTAARVLIGLALLGYVLHLADWGELVAQLAHAELLWLPAVLLVAPLNVAVSVRKWQIILRARRHRLPFRTLFGWYVLSQFYKHLLPSSAGGDVVRAVLLSRRIGSPRDALGSIVVERFTGMTVLIALAVASVLLAPALREHLVLVALVAAAAGLYLALLLAMLNLPLVRLLQRVLGRWRLAGRLIGKLERFQMSLHQHGRHPWVLARALGLSLLFHLGAMALIYFICRLLGQPVSPLAVAVAVPVVMAVALLPISLSGLGLAEWALMTTFAALGSTAALGLAAALVWRAWTIVWSAGGYFVLLFVGRSRAPAADAGTA